MNNTVLCQSQSCSQFTSEMHVILELRRQRKVQKEKFTYFEMKGRGDN